MKWVYNKLINVIIAVLETFNINFELMHLSCSGKKKSDSGPLLHVIPFVIHIFPFALESPFI